MDTLWIARHGNRQDFVDPHWADTADRPHDPDLAPDGISQADRLGARLAATDISQIVTSPFLRTAHTAHRIARHLDQPVVLEPGIEEWLNPEWFEVAPETLPPEVLADRFPHIDPTYTPCLHPSFPEARQEAFNRCARAAWCLVDRFEEESELLVVGHGASVYGILQGLVRRDLPDAECPLCSLTQLARQGPGAWEIVRRNDTDHLDQAQAGDRLHR